MLYGIRTDEQYRLAKAGYRVRSLIAYGEHWYPWYMRRLAERPANVWFALRQMLPVLTEPGGREVQNQIRNIESSTGRSIDEWVALVAASGKTKHGEIVSWLKTEHGMSHGNANRVALVALRGPAAPEGDDLVASDLQRPEGGAPAVPRPGLGHRDRVR